jgi:hypothetical protein
VQEHVITAPTHEPIQRAPPPIAEIDPFAQRSGEFIEPSVPFRATVPPEGRRQIGELGEHVPPVESERWNEGF